MIFPDCSATHGDNDNQQQQASSQCGGTNSEENSPTLLPQSGVPLSSPLAQLPESVFSFFKDVPTDGYPEGEAAVTKAQPWRNVWQGPKPSPDGRLLIALPRRVDFGSNNLGGY